VRESLFMMLEPWQGARVADLYAGSGALGIEALSRGAEWVDFVESSRPAIEALRDNLAVLGAANRARIWPLALPSGIARLGEALERADVILLDPPYGGEDARRCLAALASTRLAPGVRIVVEHHGKDDLGESPGRIARVRSRTIGETHISFYEPRDADDPA
jgi:16S rRNA (guanine966-N2)-methyltransferase